ncbi:MAG: hypothetical protein CM15mP74_15000 [Halieaceae bacterium]|nr:MAG: hypothetical protein CM15mP74_15000 [Halieaceae bacterium]
MQVLCQLAVGVAWLPMPRTIRVKWRDRAIKAGSLGGKPASLHLLFIWCVCALCTIAVHQNAPKINHPIYQWLTVVYLWHGFCSTPFACFGGPRRMAKTSAYTHRHINQRHIDESENYRLRVLPRCLENLETMKAKLEYIWLDGYQPTQSLRSKTKCGTTLAARSRNAPCGPSTAAPQSKLTAVVQTVC